MTGVSLSISSARPASRSSSMCTAPGDAARLPLVGLAHVDELRLAALDQLLHALRLEVELVSENAPMDREA